MAGNFSRIYLQGADPQEQKIKQTRKAEGEQTMWETIKDSMADQFFNSPLTARAVESIDNRGIFSDNTKLNVDQLRAKYPNAPEEFYNSDKTPLQAALLYAGYKSEDTYQRSLGTRDTGTWGTIGYGIAGSIADPLTLASTALGFGIGGVITQLGSKYKYASYLSQLGAKNSFMARVGYEAAENTIASIATTGAVAAIGAGEYGRRELEWTDVAAEIGVGTALGTAARSIFGNGTAKIAEQSLPKTVSGELLGEMLSKEFETAFIASGQKSPYNFVKSLAYNRAKLINTTSGLPRGNGLFYGITEKMTGIDTSFESKFGRTRVLVNDPLISEGIAQTAGADFYLYNMDLSGAKLVSLDTTFSDINPKTFDLLNKYLPDELVLNPEDFTLAKGKSLLDAFEVLKERMSTKQEETFFANIQKELNKEGFVGFTYTGGAPFEMDSAHTVIQLFDDLPEEIMSEMMTPVKELNYFGRKMMLEYKPLKSTQVLNEGFLSNGKKVMLNEGYFETASVDPVMASPDELKALVGIFSKEQIDDIQLKVNDHNYSSISRKYKDLVGKKDLLENIEDFKAFDEMMFNSEQAEKFFSKNGEWKTATVKQIKEMFDYLPEGQSFNEFKKNLADIKKREEFLFNEVEKMGEEFGVLAQKADSPRNINAIYNQLEDLYKQDKSKRLADALKTVKGVIKDFDKITTELSKLEIPEFKSLVKEYAKQADEVISETIKENPDVIQEITKAAVFCIRNS